MFAGFKPHRIRVEGAEIFTLTGGSGPPLLLLHGYPENHVMWHAVAPQLAASFSLVIPDLRGYGDSQGPPPDSAHVGYSKRVMAADMVAVMASLGHGRFSLAGHDRGARVAYRLALDHPDRVQQLAVLNILPTLEVWEQIKGPDAAQRYFNWLLLAQPAPVPEQLVGSNANFVLNRIFDEWAGRRGAIHPAALAEYSRHFSNPRVLEACCEDYRAGATVDVEHDRVDRESGRRITCPMFVLWGERDFPAAHGSPVAVWRRWATAVQGQSIDCGHFIAEEAPEACATALREFFSSGIKGRKNHEPQIRDDAA